MNTIWKSLITEEQVLGLRFQTSTEGPYATNAYHIKSLLKREMLSADFINKNTTLNISYVKLHFIQLRQSVGVWPGGHRPTWIQHSCVDARGTILSRMEVYVSICHAILFHACTFQAQLDRSPDYMTSGATDILCSANLHTQVGTHLSGRL